MRALAVIVAACTVLVLAVDVHAADRSASPAVRSAPAGCWLLCNVRHPIRSRDGRCESWRCRVAGEARARAAKREVYPCIVRWTYDGLRWWHLRYGVRGPYGRNHVGYGSTGYRRCW